MYLCIVSLFGREAPSIQRFRVRRCLYTANSGNSNFSDIKAEDDAPAFNFDETICEDMWTGSGKRTFACLVTATGRTVRHSPTPTIFDVAPIELAQRRS